MTYYNRKSPVCFRNPRYNVCHKNTNYVYGFNASMLHNYAWLCAVIIDIKYKTGQRAAIKTIFHFAF